MPPLDASRLLTQNLAIFDVAARKISRYLTTPKGAGPDPALEIHIKP